MTDYEHFGEYQSSDRSALGTALTFLFIGLGAGALAALLFAPKTGKQMRKLLRRKYEDALEGADELVERGGEWARRGGAWVEDAKGKVAPMGKVFNR